MVGGGRGGWAKCCLFPTASRVSICSGFLCPHGPQVRELVSFLRKRDKRVAARQVEEARLREERERLARER